MTTEPKVSEGEYQLEELEALVQVLETLHDASEARAIFAKWSVGKKFSRAASAYLLRYVYQIT